MLEGESRERSLLLLLLLQKPRELLDGEEETTFSRISLLCSGLTASTAVAGAVLFYVSIEHWYFCDKSYCTSGRASESRRPIARTHCPVRFTRASRSVSG
jgi:hypothetical protein